MALALRVTSVPRCATAYRPRSRRPEVVRAGHAGATRVFVPSPFGKEWAGSVSGFAGKISRHDRLCKPCRATNDDGVSAKEAVKEGWSDVKDAASEVGDKAKDAATQVTEGAADMDQAAKDKTSEAVDATKDKASEAVEATKNAATESKSIVAKAIDAVKGAVGLGSKSTPKEG